MGRYQKPKSSPQDFSKLPERPTKKSSASIRRGDRRRNEDIVEEVDKDNVEESDNASEYSSEDSRNDGSDKDIVEEVDKDTVEDDNNEEEFDEESSDEDNEDNLGEADAGRASSSEKGKKAVEAGEIPGQPINPRLLSYYKDHIARSVWENENPRENPTPLLKLHQHQDMYGHDKIDRALINAFRERWYPETNTYHLPFGEMTITIEDVERISRLSAKGKVVEGVFGAKTMTWEYTRSRVNAYFLQCLENLEEVNSYSWATACLAWIYHHLGQGSGTEVYSMAGCMTILQVWIYDHFPVLERHSLVGGYEECNPRASLYVPIQPERTLEFDLVDLREKLDDLTEEKVTWDPYKSIRDGSIHQVAHYTGPLKCFDVVEWHNPNRVLRQFGVIQDKPKGVFLDKEKTVSKPSSFKSYYGILVLPGKRESHISHSSDKTRNKQMPVFQLENFMEFPSYLVDEKSILLDFQTEREPKSHMMSQILFCIHVISGKRVNDISRSPHRTRNKIFTFLCF